MFVNTMWDMTLSHPKKHRASTLSDHVATPTLLPTGRGILRLSSASSCGTSRAERAPSTHSKWNCPVQFHLFPQRPVGPPASKGVQPRLQNGIPSFIP